MTDDGLTLARDVLNMGQQLLTTAVIVWYMWFYFFYKIVFKNLLSVV